MGQNKRLQELRLKKQVDKRNLYLPVVFCFFLSTYSLQAFTITHNPRVMLL